MVNYNFVKQKEKKTGSVWRFLERENEWKKKVTQEWTAIPIRMNETHA